MRVGIRDREEVFETLGKREDLHNTVYWWQRHSQIPISPTQPIKILKATGHIKGLIALLIARFELRACSLCLRLVISVLACIPFDIAVALV